MSSQMAWTWARPQQTAGQTGWSLDSQDGGDGLQKSSVPKQKYYSQILLEQAESKINDLECWKLTPRKEDLRMI